MNHIDDSELQTFLDGELPGTRRDQVSDHLADCSDCRARLDDIQALYTQIESVRDAALETDLVPGVLARLGPNRAISQRGRWLLVAELAFGLASMAAALSWLNITPPAWFDGLAQSLQVWFNLGDPSVWLHSLTTPIEMGFSAIGALSASAATPLGSALSVTGWGMLLAGLVVAGLVANGLILTRAGGQRREDRRSA